MKAMTIRRVVPLFAAASVLVVPLVAAQLPTRPFRLTKPQIDAAPFRRSNVRLAAAGDRILAVWVDWRNGGGAVWGTRLDQTGGALDPVGFKIGPGGSTPVVASNGEDFLVAWSNYGSISLARVSGGGDVQALPGITIRNERLSIAFDGTRFLLSAAGSYDNVGTYVAVLDRNGLLLQAPKAIGEAPLATLAMAAASRNQFLIVTGERAEGRLRAQRLDPDELPAPSPSHQSQEWYVRPDTSADLATDGSGYVCVWVSGRYPGGLRAIRLDVEGRPLGESVLVTEYASTATVVWTGSHYAVLYRHGLGVFAARFDRNLLPLGAAQLHATAHSSYFQGSISAIRVAGGVLVSWTQPASASDSYPIEQDVFTALWGPEGLAAGPLRVSLGFPVQQAPSGVWNGSEYLFAWLERGPSMSRVMIGGVSAGGLPLDGPGVLLADGYEAAVGGGNDRVLIAWVEVGASTSLKTAIIERVQGKPVLHSVSLIDQYSAADSLSVVWNGQQFALFYRNRGAFYGVRISKDGDAQAAVRIAAASDVLPGQQWLRAVWTGRDYYAAFATPSREPQSGFRSEPVHAATIYGVRVAEDLTPEPPVLLGRAHGTTPVLAMSGGEVIVAWTRWSDGLPPFRQEEGFRIARVINGVLLDSVNGTEVAAIFDVPMTLTCEQSRCTAYASSGAWSFVPALGGPISAALSVPAALTIVTSGGAPLAVYRDQDGLLMARYLIAPRFRAVRSR